APRVIYAMSRDRLFWRGASRVNRGGTPTVSLAVSTIVAVLIVFSGKVERVLAVLAFFFVTNYTLVFLSVFVLRRREPETPRPYRAWGYPVTTALALAGSVEQVAEPGQFFTTNVADEPVLVVRDSEGRVRAFSNVCRHRAGPVAAGSGQCKTFRCGYHGWTYSTEGRLLAAPEFDGVEGWSKEDVCLPEFRVEEWGALVFVNLDAG